MAGLYFEQFEVGAVHEHRSTRKLTEADSNAFRSLTQGRTDTVAQAEYIATTEAAASLVSNAHTVSLLIGVSTNELTRGTTVSNLGWDQVRFVHPVYHGDTLRLQTEVLDKHESRARPYAGTVSLEHRAYNQHGDLVASCRRSVLMLKAPVRRAAVEVTASTS